MQKLNSLQGLRFLGFLFIFLNHAGWLLWSNKYFDYGARGVEIFFVLSGYLIAYNYRNAEFDYDLRSSFLYMLSKAKKFYFLHLLTFLIILFHMETWIQLSKWIIRIYSRCISQHNAFEELV